MHPPSLHPYLAQDDYERVADAAAGGGWRCSRTRRCGPRWRSTSAAACCRWSTGVPAASCCTSTRCCSRRTWRCATPGSPAASSGTSAPAATPPRRWTRLHAARVDGPDGEPVLRLWEWERIRGVVFQVDLWLPAGERGAARHGAHPQPERSVPCRCTGGPTPRWSPARRPACSCRRAERCAPSTRTGCGWPPVPGRRRPRRHLSGQPPSRRRLLLRDRRRRTARPWIAAIDGDGRGVAHVSTARLQGRKLFVWGTGRGGERWQGWLSHGGAERYAEIQAGLAPTQFEHLDMPAQAEWSWSEAFAAVRRRPGARSWRRLGPCGRSRRGRRRRGGPRTAPRPLARRGGRRRRPSARRTRWPPGRAGEHWNGAAAPPRARRGSTTPAPPSATTPSARSKRRG